MREELARARPSQAWARPWPEAKPGVVGSGTEGAWGRWPGLGQARLVPGWSQVQAMEPAAELCH